jgi:hypothetical protein
VKINESINLHSFGYPFSKKMFIHPPIPKIFGRLLAYSGKMHRIFIVGVSNVVATGSLLRIQATDELK